MLCLLVFFFFNDTATTEIYPLSLHDALPICGLGVLGARQVVRHVHGEAHRRVPGLPEPVLQQRDRAARHLRGGEEDRKSTRLNSSHANISYAVFCLKKKKKLNNAVHIPELPY